MGVPSSFDIAVVDLPSITVSSVGPVAPITVAGIPDHCTITIDEIPKIQLGIDPLAVAVPANAPECGSDTALLWVRGCPLHYLRWTVEVRSRGGHACHEVHVQDCPDLVHHWDDQFYCQRPCPHGGRVAGQPGASNG